MLIPFVAIIASVVLLQPASPPASPTPPVHERCVPVPQSALDWIVTGVDGERTTAIQNAWAVKSDDFENVWFVAADIEGPDLDGNDDVALWGTNAIEEDGTAEPGGGGLVVSVNDLAREYSDWFPGEDYDVHDDDDGAEDVVECAKGEKD